jgi:uncharacterized protein YegJ (DUF2314 family)
VTTESPLNIRKAPALCPGSFVAVPEKDYALFDYDVHRTRHNDLQVPGLTYRLNRQPGDYVQLVFKEAGGDGERMWVQIVSSSGNGWYTGTLNNDPLHMRSIKDGDTVTFAAANIIRRMKDGAPSSY